MRLLLLDDDERVATGVARLVRLLGHDAVLARTTEEARRACEAGAIDIALADVDLGDGGSGLEFLAWVSTHHPRVRRVLVSGGAAPSAFRVQAPDQIFMTKPFGRAELQKLLAG